MTTLPVLSAAGGFSQENVFGHCHLPHVSSITIGRKRLTLNPSETFDLAQYGIHVKEVYRNAPPAVLYELGVLDDDMVITDAGAMLAFSEAKTGRSPADKRIVDLPEYSKDVWWGKVNIPLSAHAFQNNKQRTLDYLNTRRALYVVDGFANWDKKNHLKVRVICCRPYHALFMHNMLIRPSASELASFATPDFVILNAGEFPADPSIDGLTSNASVDINFGSNEMVVLGTQYAGEMKKGVFSVMNYLMPKRGFLSLHSAANEGPHGDVSLFLGLSGTGKTTLSTDPKRFLIGDDEHVWCDHGVFNIEGGCYAKCINLSNESEPAIFNAIKFGSVLENVVYDESTRHVDYDDGTITQNTRCSYPIEFIPRAKIPCTGTAPKNIIFLTCDAFGVLPPISELTADQAMYNFINGYTSKVTGTEMGVRDPIPTFSACFGEAFIVWHPSVYAKLLAANMKKHGSKCWLINTGWTGGAAGKGGQRMSIKTTRAILDAIHENGAAIANGPKATLPLFNLSIPLNIPGVKEDLLVPRNSWKNKAEYDEQLNKLARMFVNNFKAYEQGSPKEIKEAGPKF
jgi:phosphoenolpyruvate carboxykinase (ATP)